MIFLYLALFASYVFYPITITFTSLASAQLNCGRSQECVANVFEDLLVCSYCYIFFLFNVVSSYYYFSLLYLEAKGEMLVRLRLCLSNQHFILCVFKHISGYVNEREKEGKKRREMITVRLRTIKNRI